MIEAKIVKDSIGPSGVRLTTFVLTYPRFIHSEFMTHRAFSRNASSSRAIPVKKQIQMVIDNPAIPLAFTKNKKGMQGGDPLDQEAHDKAVAAWLEGRDRAVEIANKLADLEVHKQYANRVLEPWAHISVVCTSTDFGNFFGLRRHNDAQPEIHALADCMYEQYSISKPVSLTCGEWHLPFVELGQGLATCEEGIKMSVARCARVSYLNHEGKTPSKQEDFQLYERLLGSAPLHASPAEHQAMAVKDPHIRSGNLRGWVQFRKTLQNECVEEK